MTYLDLTPDQLLSTTRAVRKRLDLTRPVEPTIIRECIELAVQAPSGGNTQKWHFVIVTETEKKKAIGDLYRQGMSEVYGATTTANASSSQPDTEQARTQLRVTDSSRYLYEHIHEVPVLVLPCIHGRVDGKPSAVQAAVWGSILPATWSFMLAARARGLGTVWTTLHLRYEQKAAEVLGIPYDKITQTSLIPVAYTLGTDFKPGSRKPLDDILHWNEW